MPGVYLMEKEHVKEMTYTSRKKTGTDYDVSDDLSPQLRHESILEFHNLVSKFDMDIVLTFFGTV